MSYIIVAGSLGQAELFRRKFSEVKKVEMRKIRTATWSLEFSGIDPIDNKLILCGYENCTVYETNRYNTLKKWPKSMVEKYENIDDLR